MIASPFIRKSAADWQRGVSESGKPKWTNSKTGRVEYQAENPGGESGASQPESAPDPKIAGYADSLKQKFGDQAGAKVTAMAEQLRGVPGNEAKVAALEKVGAMLGQKPQAPATPKASELTPKGADIPETVPHTMPLKDYYKLYGHLPDGQQPGGDIDLSARTISPHRVHTPYGSSDDQVEEATDEEAGLTPEAKPEQPPAAKPIAERKPIPSPLSAKGEAKPKKQTSKTKPAEQAADPYKDHPIKAASAKTMTEARTNASNLGITLTGVSDSQLPAVNAWLGAAKVMKDAGFSIPKNITYDRKRVGGAMALHGHGDGLFFGDQFAQKQTLLSQGHGEYLRRSDTNLSTKHDLHEAVHELAHHALKEHAKAGEDKESWRRGTAWLLANKSKVAQDVGKYASDAGKGLDPDEFAVETLTGLMLGKKYDPEIMQAYKDVGGVIPPNAAKIDTEPTLRKSLAASPLYRTKSGRWVTIGGKSKEGKRHGGCPVYIENGKITKGPASLTGRKVSNLDKPPEESSHRKDMHREREYQKAKFAKHARKEGIDPKHLHSLADEFKKHHDAHVDDVASMLADARKNHPHLKAAALHSDRGGDSAGIKDIDRISSSYAKSRSYGHLFGGYDSDAFRESEQGEDKDHSEKFFEYLTHGTPQRMGQEDAYEQALEHLRQYKPEKKKKDDAGDFDFGANAKSLHSSPLYRRKGGLFDESKINRDDEGKFATKDHVQEARRKLGRGELKVHSGKETSHATGKPIKRWVELGNGAKIHPDELHRTKFDEHGTPYVSTNEKLTIIDGTGKKEVGSFATAVAHAALSKGPATIQGPHGYSVTLPGAEWKKIDAKGQTFAEWADDQEGSKKGDTPLHHGPASSAAMDKLIDLNVRMNELDDLPKAKKTSDLHKERADLQHEADKIWASVIDTNAGHGLGSDLPGEMRAQGGTDREKMKAVIRDAFSRFKKESPGSVGKLIESLDRFEQGKPHLLARGRSDTWEDHKEPGWWDKSTMGEWGRYSAKDFVKPLTEVVSGKAADDYFAGRPAGQARLFSLGSRKSIPSPLKAKVQNL